MSQRISDKAIKSIVDSPEWLQDEDADHIAQLMALDLRDARAQLKIAVEALEAIYEKYASNEPVQGVMKLTIDALAQIKQIEGK